MNKIQSAERVSHSDESDNFVFRRSLLAYREAAGLVSGDVLEIGTGSGYGVSVISPAAATFTTIDKYDTGIDLSPYPNAAFRRMKVPPLDGFADAQFDFVVMFQVIEHVRRDGAMLREIHRVLRPGGKLIISTPNREMSLTRNPWHVREYTCGEFEELLSGIFREVEIFGVGGRGNVMEYYEENRRSVARMERYDILRFNRWLPRPLLRIPYDLLNRLNRRRLLEGNRELTAQIKTEDYFLDKDCAKGFDLFAVAIK